MPSSAPQQVPAGGAPRPGRVEATPAKKVHPCAAQTWFNNVRVFTACVSMLFLLHGMLYDYTDGVLYHMGHRYPFPHSEQVFIAGVEQAGFISVLLIAAFFGNRLHRPITVGVGGFIAATGCFLVASPYWIHGALGYPGAISQYLQNSDCSKYFNTSADAHCSSRWSHEEPSALPFTLICLGQFLVGVGGALYTSMGIVHIDENAPQQEAMLLLGVALFMHGVGQFAGALFALRVLSIPENLSTPNDYVADPDRVGAWWLGYPIIALLLLLFASVAFFFTKWFKVPDWMVRRKSRIKQKAIDNRLRKLSRSKAKLSKRERSKKDSSSSQNHHNGSVNPSRGANIRNSKRKVSKSESAEQQGRSRKASQGANNPSTPAARVDVIRQVQLPEDVSDPPPHYDNSNGGVTNEALDVDGSETDIPNRANQNGAVTNMAFEIEETDSLRLEGAVSTSTNVDNVGHEDTNVDAAGSAQERSRGPLRRSESRSSRRKRLKYERQLKKEIANIENTRTYKRHKRYIFRSEQCKDMPRHLWRLVRNPSLVTTILGAVCASFMYTGYSTYLPEYLQTQFYRELEDAEGASAVCSSLAWSLGVLLGAILLYKKQLSPVQSLKMVLVTTGVCVLLQGVLMGIDCPEMAVALRTDDQISPLVAECNVNCDCSDIQRLPVCGEDQVTYLNPCTAGCTGVRTTYTIGLYNFTDCTCVNSGRGGHALLGECTSGCFQFYLYAIIVFITMVTYGFSVMPVVMIFLREVIRDRYRSLSIGFSIWLIYLLGAVMGPPLYSWVRSSTCLLMLPDCHGEDTCWTYDVTLLRYLHHGVTMGLLVVGLLAYIAALVIMMRKAANTTPQNIEAPAEPGAGENAAPVNNIQAVTSSQLDIELVG